MRRNTADVVQEDIISDEKQPVLSSYRDSPLAFCTMASTRGVHSAGRVPDASEGCAKREVRVFLRDAQKDHALASRVRRCAYGFVGCGAGVVRRAAAIAPIPPASSASINSVLNRLVGRK